VTGAEISFQDRRTPRREKRRVEPRAEFPAQMPTICWRCNQEHALQGRTTCERCLQFITARAAEIKEARRRAREEWQ
jgi:hypothetical protein